MAITKEEIINALHRGVRSASKSYDRWSDGLTLEASPEYLAVVGIASSIHKELGESECLRLEMPYRDVLTGAGVPKGQGRPLESIKGGKKADLVLLRKRTMKPTCVVEIKKNTQFDALRNDLKRLRDVVYACRRNKGVKHGFLVVYRSGDPDTVVGSIETFLDSQPPVDRKKARVGRPNVRTWGHDEASVVVEVRPPKDD